MRAPVLVLTLVAPTACDPAVPHSDLKLILSAFPDGGRIPTESTADGKDRAPALAWSGAPAGTRAFALVVDDPDAPGGLWVHWVAYDLPPTATGLEAGLSATPKLPGGGLQGKNSWGRLGWNGPSPPPGKPHRYFFRLYALDRPTGLPAGEDRAALDRAMKGHILGEAEWMGTYGR